MSNNIKHNLHNTHSWNRLLHRFKGHLELAVRYCKWRKGDRGGGLCVDSQFRMSGCRWEGVWALLCHTNTMLKEFKVYKTSKFLLQYCHAIYMLTRLRQRCQVYSRVSMSSLAVKGFGPGRLEDFTPLSRQLHSREGDTDFSTLLPWVRGAEDDGLQLESTIR